ncbi:MAG: phospholipase D-like domain-containing protein [Candidatus Cryosericum sp.]|nr:phospholipase D-like domain-containing protein [bacterium]
MREKGVRWFGPLVAVLLVGASALGWLGLRRVAPAAALPIVHLNAQTQCIVTPDQEARALVVSDIDRAQRSVLVECYLISDPSIVRSLQSARKRGCDVRVIMEEKPFGGFSMNQSVRNQFRSSGIDANWGNRTYAFTHAKYIVVDDSMAWIMTANLTKSAFDKNREVLIRTDSRAVVDDLTRLFWADRRRNACGAGSLVVGPVNARQSLVSMLKSSRQSIEIASEVFDDPEVYQVLVEAARQGIRVRVLVAAPDRIAVNAVTRLKMDGKHVAMRYLETPYLHVKYIVVDGKVAYVGSNNMSAGSLDENREVGIMTADLPIIQLLEATFAGDWAAGR